MSKTLIIVRGAQGSGKSTVAGALGDAFPQGEHYEADQYWMKDGEYKFNLAELGYAHDWCHMQVSAALKSGVSTVIVANTFTKVWEFAEYIREAMSYGYAIQVIHCQSTYTDIHNVPTDVVKRIKRTFEPFNLDEFVALPINDFSEPR